MAVSGSYAPVPDGFRGALDLWSRNWGTPVIEYRAFIVGDDGHFIGFEPIICRDDEEAIVKAQSFLDGHDIELWTGPRLVTRLKHQPT